MPQARDVGQVDSRSFSIIWIFVSFFLIAGGIVATVIGLAAGLGPETLDPRTAAYLSCSLGGAIGGLFAGRASPHFSVLEPAIAGGLVIGSIFALIKWTAIGPLAFAFAEEAIVRETLIMGGLAFGGGLLGAYLGELSSGRAPSSSSLRWLGMAVFITVGALLVMTILTCMLVIDQTLRDPELMSKLHSHSPLVNEDEAVMAAILMLVGAGFLGGLVTQLAAPVRMLIVSTIGVFTAVAGTLIGILALTETLTSDPAVGSLIIGGGCAVAGFVGALIGWLIRRLIG